MSNDKDRLQEEVNKMRKHSDPGQLTVEDIMGKLKLADPTKFRQAMDDLAIEGHEPVWFQQ